MNERNVGKRILCHGKYTYSGKLVSVEGHHGLLDGAEMHFACDAEVKVRRTNVPPIALGDGVIVDFNWFEVVIPEAGVKWMK